jgi:hypothetical protein
MTRKADDKQLTDALAILISSTRSKNRSKPLTEIAKWIKIASATLGSTRKVAERIGLSPQMLRQFESVERLTPAVQEMFATRQLDSVDAAAHLAMLPGKDQLYVAKLLASGGIDTSDVRAVYQLRKEGSTDDISFVVKRVIESKTKQEYIAEFVIRGSRTVSDIRNALSAYIPLDQIIRIEVEGVLGRLVLTKKGKNALSTAARRLGVRLSQVIPAMLRNGQATR